MNAENIAPAQAFPPGDYIREELDARGWTQQDLATILGRSLVGVSLIVTGKQTITPDTAKALAEAFGTSPDLWLNLESAYQLHKVQAADAGISRRAKLYEYAPIQEMVRRGWISSTDNIQVLESQVASLFDVASISERPVWDMAARKSDDYDTHSAAELAWFARVRQLGKRIQANRFSPAAFSTAFPKIRSLCGDPENIRHLPKILAEFGIRFVVVEKLKGTRIDGGMAWLSETAPVIGVSLRFDRIDSFWHTVIHELVHVKNGDKSVIDVDIISDAKGANRTKKPALEERTDAEAANYLVPQYELEEFIARVKPFFAKEKIKNFANKVKVHPGIVVGQLHHRACGVHWSHNREMLLQDQIADIITPVAMTDGWDKRLGIIGG